MWGDEVDDADGTSPNTQNVGSNRLFNFVVAKTIEQKENVTARQGFTVCYLRSQPFPPY
jgi:hypothetical protein